MENQSRNPIREAIYKSSRNLQNISCTICVRKTLCITFAFVRTTRKDVIVPTRLEPDLANKVDLLAIKLNLKRSAMIREIVKKYFNYKEKPVI